MKSLIALACSAACMTALAAGPYDGVYQYGLSPAYYSVHQSGNTLVVASLGTTALSGVRISIGGYAVTPPSIDNWSYSIGTISGSSARVVGVGIYGACIATTDVAFDTAGNLSATLVGVTDAPFGNQQGVNCAALYQSITAAVGPTLILRKIF
jgi:hypothetical protein